MSCVIHDGATFPGVVVICRVIGILKIEQKNKNKSERNDRVFAVPLRSHSEKTLKDVRDLTRPIQEELEKFFIATEELEDKKLKMIGWEGPEISSDGDYASREGLRETESVIARLELARSDGAQSPSLRVKRSNPGTVVRPFAFWIASSLRSSQ